MAIVFLVPWGLPSLNGIVLGALFHTVLMLATKQKVAQEAPEEIGEEN